MINLKSLLTELVAIESVTPIDAGCQDLMIEFLKDLDFQCQRFDNPPVSNFFAIKGQTAPLLIFAGHTDVVPIGDQSKWLSSPFSLQERGDMLYGRGVADMKGSLAAMLAMASDFINRYPKFKGSLGFLITSAEEGDLFDLGTPYVMAELKKQGIDPDYCVVGEPSSTNEVGDVLKIGRRGSLTAKLVLEGKQGHVAYPHLAENPIHLLGPALAELVSKQWDKGNDYFPPTTMQVVNLQSGGLASNIIPGTLMMDFNFRFSTEQTPESIKKAVNQSFKHHALNPSISWHLFGEPFLTNKGRLLESCISAIHKITQRNPELSTSGGTSDGRFIAPYGVEVVELGPVNATIHQINESVSLADLEKLRAMYFSICEELLTPA